MAETRRVVKRGKLTICWVLRQDAYMQALRMEDLSLGQRIRLVREKQATKDQLGVAEFLGHKDLRQIRRYVGRTDERKKRVAQAVGL
jgi:hypothetical protein